MTTQEKIIFSRWVFVLSIFWMVVFGAKSIKFFLPFTLGSVINLYVRSYEYAEEERELQRESLRVQFPLHTFILGPAGEKCIFCNGSGRHLGISSAGFGPVRQCMRCNGSGLANWVDTENNISRNRFDHIIDRLE
jgi:hypothetical protein